jgi:TRAP-type C4-dicarboxylate transport system substrate-binding protein
VRAKDYRGARIGVREGEVAKATFTALGATPVGTVPGGPLQGLDGAELDLGGINWNEYDLQARAITANVSLWPRPVTVVINHTVFESLTPRQQDALRQAGASVISRHLNYRQGFSDEARRILCRRGLRFLHASSQDLAALLTAEFGCGPGRPAGDRARWSLSDQLHPQRACRLAVAL